MIKLFTINGFLVVLIAIVAVYLAATLFKSKILVWVTTICVMVAFDTRYLKEKFLVCIKKEETY
jgi:hypothetical protein